MLSPIISFCIPTFNRREYIKETIHSITNQISSKDAILYEICVSDNASTDGTDHLIQQIQQETIVKIVYHKHQRNMGPDINYLRSIEISSGEYCWLLGSDDSISIGSIEKIRSELLSEEDIYIINRMNCSSKMHPLSKGYWLDKKYPTKTYDTKNANEFGEYLNAVISLGGVFSYLSSIIVKSKKWKEVDFDDTFLGTAYAHSFVLLEILKQGAKVRYVKEHLVNSRGGNDSFALDGLLNRYLLDFNGYSLLAEIVFSQEPILKKAILAIVKREHKGIRLLKIRALAESEKKWQEVKRILVRCGYDEHELGKTDIFGKFHVLVLYIFHLRDKIRKIRYL